jgi:hypothetical protein
MDDNLRRGNNTENLGLHLLRGIGAVAPVPRDQDVGIDAVVTLLRRDEGRRLLAGSNIFAQLKSSSIRSLVFHEDDIDWLHRLELPYFIGSVDQATSSIALFTVHTLTNLGSRIEAELVLDKTEGCINFVENATQFNEWLDLEERTRTTKVYLGPPVLKWDIEDLRRPKFLAESNQVLEAWVSLVHENRLLKSIGESKRAKWETGAPPQDDGSIGAYSKQDGTHDHAVNLVNIALKRLANEAAFDGDVTAIRSLFDAVSHFKKYGVEDRDILAAGVAAKMKNKPR